MANLQAPLPASLEDAALLSVLDGKIDFWGNELYPDVFGFERDFSRSMIPDEVKGFGWLIIAAQDLTPSQAVEKFPNRVIHPEIENLDKAVALNDRNPDEEDYAIWVWSQFRGDGRLKNLSADQLTQKGISGITLLECLLTEHFLRRKSPNMPIELKSRTIWLCPGSRFSDGSVPTVGWDPSGVLRVDRCDPDCHNDRLLAREVVCKKPDLTPKLEW